MNTSKNNASQKPVLKVLEFRARNYIPVLLLENILCREKHLKYVLVIDHIRLFAKDEGDFKE